MFKTRTSLRKLLLGVSVGIAMSFAATPGQAAPVFGSISVAEANDGVQPIYGTDTRNGWYGADLYLIGGPSSLTISYLGSEAGFNNQFWFNSALIFSTGGNTNTWDNTGGLGSIVINNVASGLLDFSFVVTNLVQSIANGFNVGPASNSPNFFVTFLHNENAASGTVVDLWLDDNGGGNPADDNHDDMVIRIAITGGQVALVPLPPALLLFGSALVGLGYLARRRRRIDLQPA